MIATVLLGAGSGTRFGKEKIFVSLLGKPLFLWGTEAFLQIPEIEYIFLVVPSQEHKDLVQKNIVECAKITIIVGGKNRFESAKIGFFAAKEKGANLILFHNIANPLVTKKEITEVISAIKQTGAGGVGRSMTSTIRKQNSGILPREELWEMETPQGVRAEVFEKGYTLLSKIPTDDLAVAEAAGILPKIIPASPQNRKITFPEDLFFLESFVKGNQKKRIGIGQDSHRFSKEGELVLGGILFPKSPKLLGNSDGDAALHAITNAVSSALGGGSLSTFSDTLCQQGTTDSKEYFRHILKKLWSAGGTIENISLSLEAKNPKLEHRFAEMKNLLAELCQISPEDIGITATSGEELTECGKGEGISAIAIVQISLLP
ncbi:2-C-methyl-D-erythritol 2,4-cyclodiphosphate synthase [Candidatus Peregrinibacteria bacterium]|nr:MAG: 2-C-methyl-D-erythritol 2,4-cyclodiphosphate synthase [Candidatus Peregrinibacteria bacterium]